MTDNQQAAREWLPIHTAPDEVPVWVFCPDEYPQQFTAVRTEGYEGPYWRPCEALVADVLDYYLKPTHWKPLPTPPDSGEWNT